jgi:apolipoprotein N-acyltransferase
MLRLLTDLALATLSGVLVFLAFPGWNVHWLAWFAFVPLLVALRDATPKWAFGLGLWAGTVTNAGGFWWMTEMLREFGHMGPLPAGAILALQAVTQGLAFALGAWLWRWLAVRGVASGWAAFLAVWAGEVATPMLFPWHLGNAISAELPFIQMADLGGVSLVSAMLYLANAALAEPVAALLGRRRPAWSLVLAALLFTGASYGYGRLRLPQVDAQQAAAPKLKLGVVEGNIGIWEKEAKHLAPEQRRPTLQHNLLLHQQLSADLARRGAELIVWPESAYQPSGAVPVVHTRDRFLAVGEGGVLWRYDGRQLVPDRGDRHGLPTEQGLLTGLSSPRGDIRRLIDRGRTVWTVTSRGASHVDLPEGETAVTTAFAQADAWGRMPTGWVVARSGHVWQLAVAGHVQDPLTGRELPDAPVKLEPLAGEVGLFDATSAAVSSAGRLVVTGRSGGLLRSGPRGLERVNAPVDVDLWTVSADPHGDGFVVAGAGGTVLQGDGDRWQVRKLGDGDLYASWWSTDGTSWVGGQRGRIWQRRSGGEWLATRGLPPVDVMAGAVDADGDVLVAARGGRLFLQHPGGEFIELETGKRTEITALIGFQAQPNVYLPRSAQRIVPALRPLPDPTLAFPEDVRDDVQVPDLEKQTPRRGFRTPLLFGAMTHGGALPLQSAACTDCYNSAILLGPDGEVLALHDKAFLLAFGEYMPLGETFPSLYALSPETSRFQSGTRTEPVMLGKARIGLLICYEDLIPRYAARVAAHNPNVFINMTNDAWFGQTAEPEHHLNLALLRSVEYRRWLVRSTNTGISVFIDAAGRRVQETQLTEAETMLRDVPLLETRTVYARVGDWPKWLLVLALAAVWARSTGTQAAAPTKAATAKRKVKSKKG